MKVFRCVLSMVVTGILVLAIGGCGDPMSTEMDTIVNIITEPPIEEPVNPPPVVVTPPPVVVTPPPVVVTPPPVVVTPPPVVVTPPTREIVMYVNPARIALPPIRNRLNASIRIRNLTRSYKGYEAGVDFDPTALQFVEVVYLEDTYRDNNSLEVTTLKSDVVDNNDGTFRVKLKAEAEDGEVFAKNGTLAILTFEVISVKPSTLELNEVNVWVDTTTRDGNITVFGTQSLPLTTEIGSIYLP